MTDLNSLLAEIIEARHRHKVGFKVITLEVIKNPFLGDLKLDFCDNLEKLDNYPFSTILIGPNGTGKSNILRAIINIFREIFVLSTSETGKRGNYVNGGFALSYLLNGQLYSFGNIEYDENEISVKAYHKKQKLWARINNYHNDDFITEIKKFDLPSSIVASSIMVTDKYPYLNKEELPIYNYLGVRSSRRSSGTRAYVRKTVDTIQNSISNNQSEFTTRLKSILEYLELEKRLVIRYKPIYKKQFYRNDLTETEFRSYFEHREEHFPDRKTDLWGTSRYKKIVDDDNLILRIVDFLKSMDQRFFSNEELEDKTHMVYDVMSERNLVEDFQMINELKQLDIITYPSISLRKKGSEFDLEESSSGEYALLSSLIGLMASVQENSLVFIDEPEVSLHPNWQMKYMNYLKEMFQSFKSCHFIIATHSHFLVSDIEGRNSQVIGLKKEEGIIPIHFKNIDTYGWSAEEILLEVFNVPTTRNLFIYEKIGEILDLIALRDTKEDQDSLKNVLDEISNKIKYLREKGIDNLSKEDPLKQVVDKLIEKYGQP